MPGYKFVTDLSVEESIKIARRTAKDLGFAVQRIEDFAFAACKGNLILSFFLGAIIAYCDFQVAADELDDETTEVSIERNRPWWTGWIGVNRVKNRAKDLCAAIADAIEENEGKVLEEIEGT